MGPPNLFGEKTQTPVETRPVGQRCALKRVVHFFRFFSSFLVCLYMFNGVLVYQKVNFAGRFQYLLCFIESVTDGPTDRQTDRQTDGRTDPLIEMRGRI